MTYAYNAVGEVTSMTSGGVTTNYGYDADGELTSASSPGDSLQYAYDSRRQSNLGDRKRCRHELHLERRE